MNEWLFFVVTKNITSVLKNFDSKSLDSRYIGEVVIDRIISTMQDVEGCENQEIKGWSGMIRFGGTT